MINTLNAALNKTLIEPLNNSNHYLVQQLAQSSKLDIENVSREVTQPLQLTQTLTVEHLWSKINDSVSRVAHLTQALLSVPSILTTIQQLNSSNGLEKRDMIFTVDDLKNRLGFHSANGGGIRNQQQPASRPVQNAAAAPHQ